MTSLVRYPRRYSRNTKSDWRDSYPRLGTGVYDSPSAAILLTIFICWQRLLDEAGGEEEAEKEEAAKSSNTGKPRVLQDGTYATETAYSSASTAAARLEAVKAATKPPLRGADAANH